MSETGASARSALGARLRTARERAGLTLLQAAERLHVDPRIIEAIETGDLETLGAAVYARGHIRRYAELVGESVSEMHDLYAASVESIAPPDLTKVPHAARRSTPGALVVPGTVLLIGFAVVGTVWWVLNNVREPASAPQEAASAASTADQSVAVTADTAVPGSGAISVVADAGTASATDVAPAATSATTAEPAAARTASESEGAALASRPAQPARPVELRFRFAEDCWIEVYDVNGRQLLFGLGMAGTSRTARGAPPLRVVLGNAAGVTVEVDGTEAVIPRAARRGRAARFSVGETGELAEMRAGPMGAVN
ncbi:MAG: DUF4115 domain-containing protein [Pseudomonadota bacterium]